ncbi:hypothetical protein D3C75_493460 [compost metagenome]
MIPVFLLVLLSRIIHISAIYFTGSSNYIMPAETAVLFLSLSSTISYARLCITG